MDRVANSLSDKNLGSSLVALGEMISTSMPQGCWVLMIAATKCRLWLMEKNKEELGRKGLPAGEKAIWWKGNDGERVSKRYRPAINCNCFSGCNIGGRTMEGTVF